MKETKNSLRIQVIYSRGIHLVICQDDTNFHGSHEIPCENFVHARADTFAIELSSNITKSY